MKINLTLAFLLSALLITAGWAEKDTKPADQSPQSTQPDAEYFEQQVKSAPQLLADIKKKLNSPLETVDVAKNTALSIEKVEVEKAKAEAKLAAARAKAEALATQATETIERMAKLPAEIADVREQLVKLASNTGAGSEERAALETRLTKLEWEQKYYIATAALFTAREQLNKREVVIAEKEQKAWQQLFESKHSEETQQAREKAEAEVQRYSAIPLLADLADENARLAKLRESFSNRAATTRNQLAHIQQQFKEVKTQRIIAQERIKLLESARLKIDTETGKLLRIQRGNLPTSEEISRNLQDNIKTSASAQIELLEIRKMLSSFPVDIDEEAARLLAETGSADLDKQKIRELLTQKQALLQSLVKDLSNYIESLNKTSSAIRNLGNEQQRYSQYLDERLLWIPSAKALALSDIAVERDGIVRLFSQEQLGEWLLSLQKTLQEHPVSWMVFVVSLVALISRRHRLQALLAATTEKAADKSSTNIAPTFQALGATLLVVLPLPMLLGFVGWRVVEPRGIHHALIICASFLFLFGVFLKMTGKHGFLKEHVKMADFRVKHLRYHLRWFVWATAPVLFFFFALPGTEVGAQAGRLFFIVLMLLQLSFLHLVFRPAKNMIAGTVWVVRMTWIIVIAIPIGFMIGSGMGYISSVNTLREQTMGSVCLILIGLLVMKVFERWILLSRRRLAMEIADKKYQAQLEAQAERSEDDTTPRLSLEEVEADAADVVTVEAQTKQLLKIGMGALVAFGIISIWASSLPALSFLDEVKLGWGGDSTESVTTGGKSAPVDPVSSSLSSLGDSADSAEKAESPNKDTSLQDLIMACIILALFLTAARNLPSLLELTVLHRLDLKPGGNYAVTTVLRYAFVAVGLLVAFKMIGITWASVQWLAAAITLGIGFGLQEIFANFVAGIILLFERPIRLGDVVTVGDGVSGKVTRIQIRATTILQFNGRELVVPNKQFITGSLINWTLTNTRLRFELPVGIAYGADTEKATKLLHEVANNHPKTLTDPAPQVIFKTFGASSLDFLVRAHVGHVEDFATTQSELHYLINDAFREAGIEIAFPQQDVHIRSLPQGVPEPTPENLVGSDTKPS